jgi:hypothetical protein
MKILSTILLTFILCEVTFALGRRPAVEKPTPSPIAIITPTPEPVNTNIILSCDQSCTDDERASIPKLEFTVESVMDSECFYDALTNRSMTQTNGLTREAVVKKLRNKALNLTLSYYYEDSSTVGYMDYRYPVIHANRKFYDKYSLCTKAGNIGHESSHFMDFTHDFLKTPRRPYSVPYSVNYAFSKCCK